MRSKYVIHICVSSFGKNDQTAKDIVKCIELSSQKKDKSEFSAKFWKMVKNYIIIFYLFWATRNSF